jgi:glycosyltransferase involved in cell wall biosynthesis
MNLDSKKRVLIVLYAGDYYDAYQRMISGKGEAYQHHNYALKSISEFAKQDGVEEVAVLGCATSHEYNHFLDIGFRVIGAGFPPHENPKRLNQIIADFRPTHLVLRIPSCSILKWSIKNKVKTITLLADSFCSRDLKSRFKNFRLARLLNHPIVEWVGNHHVNSCRSLQKLGVYSNKIVPWDWPCNAMTPLDFLAKEIDHSRQAYSFFYVGSVSESKGVGDLIDAVALLRKQGIDACLNIAGRGPNLAFFENQAVSLGIRDSINFLGFVPNDKVIYMMRDADIVFVPSRHIYPEGLPLTIYEALCSRTPLIASDHPMFLSNIEDGYSALIFPEKRPQELAKCVLKLLSDPKLYYHISENAYMAWKQLQIPVKWADFIDKWISEKPEDQAWINSHSLSSGRYSRRQKVTN